MNRNFETPQGGERTAQRRLPGAAVSAMGFHVSREQALLGLADVQRPPVRRHAETQLRPSAAVSVDRVQTRPVRDEFFGTGERPLRFQHLARLRHDRREIGQRADHLAPQGVPGPSVRHPTRTAICASGLPAFPLVPGHDRRDVDVPQRR
jgi:hypothetical protein